MENGVRKEKLVAGLLGIFLGVIGIHKFYLGYTKEGVIMLVVSLATCGLGAIVMEIIGFIEGLLYLTKSDEDFQAILLSSKQLFNLFTCRLLRSPFPSASLSSP